MNKLLKELFMISVKEKKERKAGFENIYPGEVLERFAEKEYLKNFFSAAEIMGAASCSEEENLTTLLFYYKKGKVKGLYNPESFNGTQLSDFMEKCRKYPCLKGLLCIDDETEDAVFQDVNDFLKAFELLFEFERGKFTQSIVCTFERLLCVNEWVAECLGICDSQYNKTVMDMALRDFTKDYSPEKLKEVFCLLDYLYSKIPSERALFSRKLIKEYGIPLKKQFELAASCRPNSDILISDSKFTNLYLEYFNIIFRSSDVYRDYEKNIVNSSLNRIFSRRYKEENCFLDVMIQSKFIIPLAEIPNDEKAKTYMLICMSSKQFDAFNFRAVFENAGEREYQILKDLIPEDERLSGRYTFVLKSILSYEEYKQRKALCSFYYERSEEELLKKQAFTNCIRSDILVDLIKEKKIDMNDLSDSKQSGIYQNHMDNRTVYESFMKSKGVGYMPNWFSVAENVPVPTDVFSKEEIRSIIALFIRKIACDSYTRNYGMQRIFQVLAARKDLLELCFDKEDIPDLCSIATESGYEKCIPSYQKLIYSEAEIKQFEEEKKKKKKEEEEERIEMLAKADAEKHIADLAVYTSDYKKLSYLKDAYDYSIRRSRMYKHVLREVFPGKIYIEKNKEKSALKLISDIYSYSNGIDWNDIVQMIGNVEIIQETQAE